jgi:hypothetical protein
LSKQQRICHFFSAVVYGVADCIFWYKARLEVDGFRLCAGVYYNLENQYRRVEGTTVPSIEEQEFVAKKTKVSVLKEDHQESRAEEPDDIR